MPDPEFTVSEIKGLVGKWKAANTNTFKDIYMFVQIGISN